MSKSKKWHSLGLGLNKNKEKASSCGCGKSEGCNSNKEQLSADEFYEAAVNASIGEEKHKDGFQQVFDVKMDRRTAFKKLTASLLIGAGAVSTSCSSFASDETKEKAQIDWEEQFKGNYKLMTDEEKQGTVNRLMRSYELRTGKK